MFSGQHRFQDGLTPIHTIFTLFQSNIHNRDDCLLVFESNDVLGNT